MNILYWYTENFNSTTIWPTINSNKIMEFSLSVLQCYITSNSLILTSVINLCFLHLIIHIHKIYNIWLHNTIWLPFCSCFIYCWTCVLELIQILCFYPILTVSSQLYFHYFFHKKTDLSVLSVPLHLSPEQLSISHCIF